MSVAHKIATVCTWGTSAPGTGITLGKLLSLDKKDTCKPVEITDENGELGTLVLTDRRTEFTAEILSTTGATAPVPGATLTVAGTDYIVRDSETVWTAGQARKFRVSGWLNSAFA